MWRPLASRRYRSGAVFPLALLAPTAGPAAALRFSRSQRSARLAATGLLSVFGWALAFAPLSPPALSR